MIEALDSAGASARAPVRTYGFGMPAESDRPHGRRHGFAVVRRGYAPAQVDQALAQLDGLVADRERLLENNQQFAARLAAATGRAHELEARMKHLSASAASADGLSERVRAILELATDEANALTAQANELLEQARASQAEADHRLAQLEIERSQVLAAARTAAEQARQQAASTASAVRADAEAERERILRAAGTTAANVVADAHRAAAADVDRLREHLHAELPRSVDAVLNDAIKQLPRTLAGAPTVTDAAESVVLPPQRAPQTGPPEPAPDSR
jgi:DivIVA domain-containing protein